MNARVPRQRRRTMWPGADNIRGIPRDEKKAKDKFAEIQEVEQKSPIEILSIFRDMRATAPMVLPDGAQNYPVSRVCLL